MKGLLGKKKGQSPLSFSSKEYLFFIPLLLAEERK
jgi:hypothetical protein